MHRNLSRPSGPRLSGSSRPLLSALVLGLTLLVVATWVAPLTPSTGRVAASESLASSSASCKPQPPYGVQLTAAGDGQWSLELRNSSSAQEMVVWMWSEIDAAAQPQARQKVWSGRLDADALQHIMVRYAPSARAQQVWASLEAAAPVSEPQHGTVRGVAVAAGPAAGVARAQKNHVVTEDPATGRQVMQFVGQGGLQ